MPQQKASTRMNELIRSLQQALGRLDEGKLGLAELEQCTEDARAVFERFVVLRHKAREATVGATQKTAPAGPATPVAEPVAVEERAAIRLDTRPTEGSTQTSLIDAIAETETDAATAPAPVAAPPPTAKAPAPKPAKAAPAKGTADRPLTVADRMEHAAVADLRKAIALSQKFWFVAELFGGDRKRYEEAIDALNAMGGLAEAEAYVQAEITAKQTKPPGEEVATAFMELLQRRFR